MGIFRALPHTGKLRHKPSRSTGASVGTVCLCWGLTSLKLSKAARMMSWPPRTRQTAASSSSTSALVLWGHGV